jgi:hypothetical protein
MVIEARSRLPFLPKKANRLEDDHGHAHAEAEVIDVQPGSAAVKALSHMGPEYYLTHGHAPGSRIDSVGNY